MKKDHWGIAFLTGALVAIAGVGLVLMGGSEKTHMDGFIIMTPVLIFPIGLLGTLFKEYRQRIFYPLGIIVSLAICFVVTYASWWGSVLGPIIVMMTFGWQLAIAFVVSEIPHLFFSKNERKKRIAMYIICAIALIISLGAAIIAGNAIASGWRLGPTF